MLVPALIPLLLACQDPEPAAPPPVTVVLHLNDGGVVTGTLLRDTPSYVEVRVDAATVVGLERRRIAKIERSSADPVPALALPLRPRDEWYVLHDGLGRVIGQLHSVVAASDEGGCRIDEEWSFTSGDRTTVITLLEECDRELRPRRAFYRERVQTAASPHLLVERTVRATIEPDQLVLERHDLNSDPERREIRLDAATTFPLLSLEQARQHGVPATRVRVFDLQAQEFAWREFTLRLRRKVPHGGGTLAVRELCWTGSGATNHEWLDSAGRPLRREANGTSVVALPMGETQTRHLAETRPEIFEPAFRSEAGRQFGLWLPSPVWRHASEVPAGRLTAHASAHRASITVMQIPQHASDAHVEDVADTVLRQLRLLHPALHVERRERLTWRGHDAIDVLAGYEITDEGARTRHRCMIRVLAGTPIPLAVCIAAPRDELFDLEPDLPRLLDGLELDPRAVEPVMQGPLAEGSARGKPRAGS